MGCTDSKVEHSIQQFIGEDRQNDYIVASINYSGLTDSPYEFYGEGQLLQENKEQILNNIFKEFCQQEKLDLESSQFSWSFKDIDKEYRTERFSPLYDKKCGIDINQFMMNRKDFMDAWQKKYSRKQKKLKQIFLKLIRDKKFDGILLKDKSNSSKNIKQTSQSKQNYGFNNQTSKQQHPKDVHDPCDNLLLAQYSDVIKAVKQQLKLFDYLVFKSIMACVYGRQRIKGIEQEQSKQYNLRSYEYRKFQENKFSQSYLNQHKKFDKLYKALKRYRIDVLFIQDISKQFEKIFEKKVNGYRIVLPDNEKKENTSTYTAIILNNKKFSPDQHFSKFNYGIFKNEWKKEKINIKSQYKKRDVSPLKRRKIFQEKKKGLSKQLDSILNINNKTIIQFTNQFILISTHLTSNKNFSKKKASQSKNQQAQVKKLNPNEQQLQKLRLCLQFLRQRFPNHKIILGGTLNNSVNWLPKSGISQTDSNIFHVYPNPDKKIMTCNQKRTFMQAQSKKANKVVKQTKDYLISSIKIDQSFVMTINGQIIDSDLQLKEEKLKQGSLNNTGLNFFQYLVQSSLDKRPLMPNENHPFGSYLLIGKIIDKKPKQLTKRKSLQDSSSSSSSSSSDSNLQSSDDEHEINAKISIK